MLSSMVHLLVNKENLRKSEKDDENKDNGGYTIEDGEEVAESQTLEGKSSHEKITNLTEEMMGLFCKCTE